MVTLPHKSQILLRLAKNKHMSNSWRFKLKRRAGTFSLSCERKITSVVWPYG